MMRIVVFFAVLLFSNVGFAQYPAGKIPVTFYYSEHCGHCTKIKKEIIPELEKRYADAVMIVRKNNAEEKVYKEFLSLCSQYHVDAFVPALYVVLSPSERYLFVGADNISSNIFTLLDGFLAEKKR
jgi:thiol-disulfide isomerase/thioredoxin